VFGMRKKESERKKLQKSMNKFKLKISQNLFISQFYLLSFSFLQNKGMINFNKTGLIE
jgi:hypothetical protein